MSSIVIKKCRAKNFLSIGNHFIEFDLVSSNFTLIVGKNGSGKSTVLEIICYGLYGKPYREVKLAQLINSINNKDCLVEVEFDVLGISYLVRRGMKPGIFEIYKNGDLVTAESATRDYQKILEGQILRMGIKSFKQLVGIGSATYKPFMQLKAGERREIIEDILDISIFSKMGEISRHTERDFKSDISRLKSEALIRSETLDTLNKNLSSLLTEIANLDKIRNTESSALNLKISTEQEKLATILSRVEELKERTSTYDEIKKAERALASKISGLESQVLMREASINKVMSTEECPTCGQTYPEESRQRMINEHSDGLSSQKETLCKLRDLADKMLSKVCSMETDVTTLNTLMSDARVAAGEIKSASERLSLMNDVSYGVSGLKNIQDSIIETSDLVNKLNQEIAEKQSELEYYTVISAMLKDSGIKATIVARYLPIINKLINSYLESFGLFVGFELSPTFEETIKARHRDTYSYNSFSEGEKSKIDCAILMTWRHIASLKSTMSCNLLFLDEVGGESLDFDSHEQMIKMIGGSAENVFLITHREAEEELFDRVWEFSKPKNYTHFEERIN